MELLEGCSLDKHHKYYFLMDEADQNRYLQQWDTFLTQALATLNDLHQAGVIHRDIKPANLFLTKDNQIKFIDFGGVCNKNKNPQLLPIVQGTYNYMAPYFLKRQHDPSLKQENPEVLFAEYVKADLRAMYLSFFVVLNKFGPKGAYNAENKNDLLEKMVQNKLSEPCYFQDSELMKRIVHGITTYN